MVIILAAYIIIVQREYSFKPTQDEKAIGDFILVSNSILSENGKIVILFKVLNLVHFVLPRAGVLFLLFHSMTRGMVSLQ